jgi:hypothetical protein
MKSLATFAASIVLAVSSACAPGASPPRVEAAVWGPFPPVKHSIELRKQAGNSPTLSEVLAKLSQASGVVFSANTVTEAELNDTAIHLTVDVVVPPEHAYTFVESLLAQHNVFLSVLSSGSPPLIGVHANVSGPAVDAHFDVPPEHLDFLSTHPALLVQTSISLHAVDVRTLGNSLRGMSDRPGNLMPVANTNAVALVGTGRQVADQVALLTRVNADCAAAMAPPTPGAEPRDIATPPPTADSANSAAVWVALPTPGHALEIRASGERKPRLGDLLKQISAATGVVFTTTAGFDEMADKTLINLSADAVVPTGEVWSFFEALLMENSCVLSVLSTGTPALLGVYSTRMPGVRGTSVNVRVEALDFLRAHPALLVQTALSLPSVDVRTLGNSLRGLSGNDTVSALMPVGNSHSVVLSGTGKYVVDMVELLQRIDADCAAGLKLEEAVKRELDAEPTKK